MPYVPENEPGVRGLRERKRSMAKTVAVCAEQGNFIPLLRRLGKKKDRRTKLIFRAVRGEYNEYELFALSEILLEICRPGTSTRPPN